MFDEIKKIINEIKEEENKTKEIFQIFQEMKNYKFQIDELEKLRERIENVNIHLCEIFERRERTSKKLEKIEYKIKILDPHVTEGLENFKEDLEDYLRGLKDINSSLESIVRDFYVWGRATKNLKELFDTVTEYHKVWTSIRRQ